MLKNKEQCGMIRDRNNAVCWTKYESIKYAEVKYTVYI